MAMTSQRADEQAQKYQLRESELLFSAKNALEEVQASDSPILRSEAKQLAMEALQKRAGGFDLPLDGATYCFGTTLKLAILTSPTSGKEVASWSINAVDKDGNLHWFPLSSFVRSAQGARKTAGRDHHVVDGPAIGTNALLTSYKEGTLTRQVYTAQTVLQEAQILSGKTAQVTKKEAWCFSHKEGHQGEHIARNLLLLDEVTA